MYAECHFEGILEVTVRRYTSLCNDRGTVLAWRPSDSTTLHVSTREEPKPRCCEYVHAINIERSDDEMVVLTCLLHTSFNDVGLRSFYLRAAPVCRLRLLGRATMKETKSHPGARAHCPTRDPQKTADHVPSSSKNTISPWTRV